MYRNEKHTTKDEQNKQKESKDKEKQNKTRQGRPTRSHSSAPFCQDAPSSMMNIGRAGVNDDWSVGMAEKRSERRERQG